MNSPQMPTLPAVAVQVSTSPVDATSNWPRSPRSSSDPAIATRVKTVNSASTVSPARSAASVRLSRIWEWRPSGSGLGFSLARTLKDDDDVVFDFNEYWRRSILSAGAARAIAGIVRKGDPDEAFVAAAGSGSGDDRGWVLRRSLPQLLDLTEDHNRLSDPERRHFEIDHAQIGRG